MNDTNDKNNQKKRPMVQKVVLSWKFKKVINQIS